MPYHGARNKATKTKKKPSVQHKITLLINKDKDVRQEKMDTNAGNRRHMCVYCRQSILILI